MQVVQEILVSNDLHIPGGPHCDDGTRHTHTCTESLDYTDVAQIVSKPYKNETMVTEKVKSKHKSRYVTKKTVGETYLQ